MDGKMQQNSISTMVNGTKTKKNLVQLIRYAAGNA